MLAFAAVGALSTGFHIGRFARTLAQPGATEADGDAAAPECQAKSSVAAPKREVGDTQLIDGNAIAAEVRSEVRELAVQFQKEHGVLPGLAVILVGSRKDSQSDVRNKRKAAAEVNFQVVDLNLPETVSQEDLIQEIEELNNDPSVHAISVQLPLPKHIEEATVLKAIRVDKDADGFSALNIGNLCLQGGDPPLAVPCTPAGCIELLQRSHAQLAGKNAVVIGRSNIVGMPIAQLLQSMDATVTVCHSNTRDMASHVRSADIVVAAAGRAGCVRGEWLKPGCVVIDVGVNAAEDSTEQVGDVNFAEAQGVAAHITPVPGGVGPMTTAMLLKNTLNLARHSLCLPRLPLRRPCQQPDSADKLPTAGQNAAEAANLGASKLPKGEDFAVVMSCKAEGGDIWAAAVAAADLREKVQKLSSSDKPPAVVLHAGAPPSGGSPVLLATLGGGSSQRKVLCSATSLAEAAESLLGA